MDNVERMLKTTVEELDRLLNARNVLGDPIERDGATIIPIVSFGFAFGAGSGSGEKSGAGEGSGGGAGGGGGIKPLGAIIIDKDGARVEGVHGAVSEIARALGDAASKAIERAADKAAPPSGSKADPTRDNDD